MIVTQILLISTLRNLLRKIVENMHTDVRL